MQKYNIAVNFPHIQSILTYESDISLLRGQLVNVPLGKRKEKGIVLSQENSKEIEKIKRVDSIITEDIVISEHELELYQWMSHYYHYSLGKLIYDCMPKILKRPRELTWIQGAGSPLPFKLSNEQTSVFSKIMDLGLTTFHKSLIHGVTGSGKTAIYLNLIKEVFSLKKNVLFLLPEINLTSQFIKTFSEFLDCKVYCYHSGVSQSEKYRLWKELPNEEGPVLILGVRSSLFLPIKNLGLIVVDEEHDSSFKQDDRCAYNARDVAIKRASLLNIPVILASATPSLESFQSQRNTNKYFTLKKRVNNSKLPEVELLDLKGDENQSFWPLHSQSIEKIREALEKNEQVLVFVNKLGFSRFLQCRGCGHRFMCPNCSVTLTPYQSRKSLECHHCSYKEPAPTSCPKCSCLTLSHQGFGTEKVQMVLKEIFPQKVIERFDRDEIKNSIQIEEKLESFHRHEIDVFVGTQMLSKGHNFKRVNTVIILGADSQLNFPDFRSEEKVYQLLTQITGRAGRYGEDSKVVIQTYQPEYELFEIIKKHEFDEFYFNEVQMRKAANCPPFTRLATLTFHGRFQKNVQEMSQRVADELRKLIEEHFSLVKLLGPRASVIEKRAGKFSWVCLLKSEDVNQLHNLIKTFELNYKKYQGVEYKIDIDPQFLL